MRAGGGVRSRDASTPSGWGREGGEEGEVRSRDASTSSGWGRKWRRGVRSRDASTPSACAKVRIYKPRVVLPSVEQRKG